MLSLIKCWAHKTNLTDPKLLTRDVVSLFIVVLQINVDEKRKYIPNIDLSCSSEL